MKTILLKKRKRNCKSLPDLPLPISKLENKNNSTKISVISNHVKMPALLRVFRGRMPLRSALAKLLVTLKH
jgi:hypothetical protein